MKFDAKYEISENAKKGAIITGNAVSDAANKFASFFTGSKKK